MGRFSKLFHKKEKPHSIVLGAACLLRRNSEVKFKDCDSCLLERLVSRENLALARI
jgi:hypothetical protein